MPDPHDNGYARKLLDDIPEEEGGLAIADAAIATLREQTYPRLFRGGFLVTLYATFEECLRQMGDAAVRFSDKDDVPPFERRVSKSLLDAACDHFFGKLGYERWPTALEDDLKALGDVRNCFAHSAGKATGRWRRRIDAWNDAVGTLAFTEDDYIIPSQRFMRESRVNVTVAVEHVLQQTPAGMAR